jgi:hypothetical protein
MPHGILIWVDPVNGDGAIHLAQAEGYVCAIAKHDQDFDLRYLAHSTAFIGMLMLIKRYGEVFDFLCAAVPVKTFGSL